MPPVRRGHTLGFGRMAPSRAIAVVSSLIQGHRSPRVCHLITWQVDHFMFFECDRKEVTGFFVIPPLEEADLHDS
jgi:hypothetical protein